MDVAPDNPFAPPAEVEHPSGLFQSRPGIDGPWRDASDRVVAKAGKSTWPEACVRCGSTRDTAPVRHGFKRGRRWGPLLVPLTYGAYLFVHLAAPPDVVVHPCLCPRHRLEHALTRTGWAVGLGLLAVMTLVAFMYVETPAAAAGIAIVATLWALWLPTTVLRAERLEGRVVYLEGAHSHFVRTLPRASSEDVEILYADVPDLS